MTLRITPHEDDSELLKLDGTLTHEEVPVLYGVVETKGAPVRLDLSGLQSADRDGLAALRQLRDGGASLRGASPYVALLLDDDVAGDL